MSERRSRSLRDSGLVSEYLDVIVYGAFAVVGSMLIVFAKLLSMHNGSFDRDSMCCSYWLCGCLFSDTQIGSTA